MRSEKTNILLIEDNPGDVRLLRETLMDSPGFDFELTQVGRLYEAMQFLLKRNFDVILLDLALPDCTGLRTLVRLREKVPNIAIILLTGSEDETLAINALKEGAQDYLTKNLMDSNVLIRSITYAIERQRLLVEMKRARKLEQHLAYHDALTGLPNRQLFYDRLEQALVHAKRNSKQVAVFFVDLDGFKRINDNQGHAAGDRFLQLVAERLKNGIRESDTVARIGGDEFTVILKDLKSSEDAANVARKVLSILAEPFVLNDESFLITASLGISVYPFDGDDCEVIIKKADSAMYHAKAQGKNNYQLFNSYLKSRDSNDSSMEIQLRKALDKNQLCVYYQPQINFQTGKIIGVEALVRLQHPELGIVLPGKFISVAEETGLIVPLGEWVLHTACQQSKALQDKGFANVPVAVNLSARQFREHSFTETISDVLRETGLPPQHLRLEITETCAMQNVKYTIATLTELKEHGVQIVLDDFGTGYSSLSYLKRFPIDILKIDRSFLKEVPTNKQDAAIITAIIALTRSLGMSVIAEGVENKGQIDFLQSVDCSEMQGFYFSKPLPFDELQDKLRSSLVPKSAGDSIPLLVVE